jgi:outer membrane protein
MKIKLILMIMFLIAFSTNFSSAQKVAFIVSDVIRDNFPEARQAEQRIKSIVEDWKREIEGMDKRIEDLKLMIAKNRLVWTDEEKLNKEKELADANLTRLEFSRKKFEPGGEYDQLIKAMMKPIEEKIFATIQQVASDEGFDIILDKSTQNIPYSNAKFDMTVKTLRKLGVDVEKLEKELQEKIKKDPRNQKPDPKQAPGKRTKSRTNKDNDREIEREENKPPDEKPLNPMNPMDPNLSPNPSVLPDSLKPDLR